MDRDVLADLFADLGEVRIKRMFSGCGIYHHGLIIAVEMRGQLMLKADAELAAELEAVGCRRWTYVGKRHGKEVAMPYWSVPESALDDPEEMAVWARKSYEAAKRAAS